MNTFTVLITRKLQRNKYYHMKKLIVVFSTVVCITLQAQQIKPSVVNALGGSANYSGRYHAWSVGEPIIGSLNGSTANLNQGFLQTWPALAKEIVLKLYLQGLWNGSGLNKAQNGSGDAFGGEVADQVAIELHEAGNYSEVPYAVADVSLSTNGLATITVPAAYTGSYYLTVKHRNSLTTTTALPVPLSGTSINYDFTDAAAKAFGSNLIELSEGVFGLYVGDVNQDGVVDALDIEQLSGAASAFASGYLSTDCNGDGVVDALDLIVTDNNAATSATVIVP
jgi:hypothetical protein